MCRKLVTLCTYESASEADYDRLKLMLYGIQGLLLGDAPILAPKAVHTPDIRLMVPETEFMQAAKVLHLAIHVNNNEKTLSCAVCASSNIATLPPRLSLKGWIKAIMHLITVKQPYPLLYSFHCRDCGNRFMDEPGKLSKD